MNAFQTYATSKIQYVLQHGATSHDFLRVFLIHVGGLRLPKVLKNMI
jgi:hypothetical protein